MAKKKIEICIGLTTIEMVKIKILVSMVIFLKTRRECDKFMCKQQNDFKKLTSMISRKHICY